MFESLLLDPEIINAANKGSRAINPDPIFVLELLPGVVGWVIGRAGARIKEIQAEFLIKMWVDQDVPDDQPRRLFFQGNRASCDLAVAKVRGLIADAPLLQHSKDAKIVSNIAECPAELVGLLIGKKGWTIKKIQQESGAQIAINQSIREGLPRKIIVSGLDANVRRALVLIHDVLRTKMDNGDFLLPIFREEPVEITANGRGCGSIPSIPHPDLDFIPLKQQLRQVDVFDYNSPMDSMFMTKPARSPPATVSSDSDSGETSTQSLSPPNATSYSFFLNEAQQQQQQQHVYLGELERESSLRYKGQSLSWTSSSGNDMELPRHPVGGIPYSGPSSPAGTSEFLERERTLSSQSRDGSLSSFSAITSRSGSFTESQQQQQQQYSSSFGTASALADQGQISALDSNNSSFGYSNMSFPSYTNNSRNTNSSTIGFGQHMNRPLYMGTVGLGNDQQQSDSVNVTRERICVRTNSGRILSNIDASSSAYPSCNNQQILSAQYSSVLSEVSSDGSRILGSPSKQAYSDYSLNPSTSIFGNELSSVDQPARGTTYLGLGIDQHHTDSFNRDRVPQDKLMSSTVRSNSNRLPVNPDGMLQLQSFNKQLHQSEGGRILYDNITSSSPKSGASSYNNNNGSVSNYINNGPSSYSSDLITNYSNNGISNYTNSASHYSDLSSSSSSLIYGNNVNSNNFNSGSSSPTFSKLSGLWQTSVTRDNNSSGIGLSSRSEQSFQQAHPGLIGSRAYASSTEPRSSSPLTLCSSFGGLGLQTHSNSGLTSSGKHLGSTFLPTSAKPSSIQNQGLSNSEYTLLEMQQQQKMLQLQQQQNLSQHARPQHMMGSIENTPTFGLTGGYQGDLSPMHQTIGFGLWSNQSNANRK